MATLCECAKITRNDGLVVGITSLDKALTISGVTYNPSGFTPSALDQSPDLAASNLDADGFLSLPDVAEVELGRYDNAKVEIFIYDYEALAVTEVKYFVGNIGQVTLIDGGYTMELRSIRQLLKQDLTQKYSPTCRAELGDARCTKSLTSFTHSGTVTAVTNKNVFAASGLSGHAVNYFKYGYVSWTSGLNNGTKMGVDSSNAGVFSLFVPAPFTIQVGDTFNAIAGCDKLGTTCKNTFNNVVNFRGEFYLPGKDQILKYPNAR